MARTEKCTKSEDTLAAWPQIILLLMVEELTIEENWAISVAASCTVLSDRQGDRANFQSHWDGESCKLPGMENLAIER